MSGMDSDTARGTFQDIDPLVHFSINSNTYKLYDYVIRAIKNLCCHS